MGTTHHDVVGAVADSVSAVVDGLSQSPTILDIKSAPQTRLHKLFSVELQTANTGKYRDAPSRHVRVESELTLRVAHRLNPKDQTATQRTALRDEQNAVNAVLTDGRKPFDQVRRRYLRTRRALNPAREWLFSDIAFGLAYDLDLTTEVDF